MRLIDYGLRDKKQKDHEHNLFRLSGRDTETLRFFFLMLVKRDCLAHFYWAACLAEMSGITWIA